MNIRLKLLASVAAVAFAAPGVASAASLGIDFDPSAVGAVGYSSYTWTLGYEFTDVTATDVVGLASWNSNINGTVYIGLWAAGNAAPLATTTVNAASPTIGAADWVYNLITPVPLTPGATYLVGSYGPTNYSYYVNPISVNPLISYNHNAWTYGGLNYPGLQSGTFAEHAFYGGNVLLAPEPSTWVMLGIGFAGLGAAAVRRRRREVVAA